MPSDELIVKVEYDQEIEGPATLTHNGGDNLLVDGAGYGPGEKVKIKDSATVGSRGQTTVQVTRPAVGAAAKGVNKGGSKKAKSQREAAVEREAKKEEEATDEDS